MTQNAAPRKVKSVSYAKWGYIFLIPFFLTFTIFTIIPLGRTFYYSLFEQRMEGLTQVAGQFVGLDNFVKLFKETNILTNLGNTVTMWLLGFIPQIIASLALAVWFTDHIMKIKYQPFFKTVIYMPNLIMASAFSMLFFVLFSNEGPVNKIIMSLGMEQYRFLAEPFGSRFLIALMNFMMWFGNTTIILMAAIMGIDTSMFEAAEIDGASAWKTFTHVTIPMIMPVLSYTLITSLIGGLQMFDVPQILTSARGMPATPTNPGVNRTVIMQLNSIIGQSKNYGEGGALSVVLFIITAILGMIVFYSLNGNEREAKKLAREGQRKVAMMKKGGAKA